MLTHTNIPFDLPAQTLLRTAIVISPSGLTPWSGAAQAHRARVDTDATAQEATDWVMARSLSAALDLLPRGHYDAIFVCTDTDRRDLEATLSAIRDAKPQTPLFVVLETPDFGLARTASRYRPERILLRGEFDQLNYTRLVGNLDTAPAENLAGQTLPIETLLEQISIPAFIREPDGSTIHVNRAAENFFRASPEKLASIEFPIEPQAGTTVEQTLQVPSGPAMVVRTVCDEISWQGQRANLLTFQDITATGTSAARIAKSQRQYQLLADNIDDAVILLRKDGSPLYQSPSFARLYRRELTDLQRLEWLVIPEDRDLLAGEISRLLRSADKSHLIVRTSLGGRQIRWIESRARTIVDDKGLIEGVLVVQRDVTTQQEGRSALEQSERRYRLLAENGTDLITQFGPDLDVRYRSLAFARLFGANAKESDLAAAHVHADDRQAMVDLIGECFQNARPSRLQLRYMLKPDNPVWFDGTLTPLSDSDGNVDSVVLVARDISQYRDALEKRLESESRYRVLADNASDFIQLYGTQGERLYQSPSMTRAGFSPNRPAGGAPILEEDRAVVAETIRRSIDEQQALTFIYRARLNGDLRHFEAAASPVISNRKHPGQVVVVSRDVTERVISETAREQNQRLYQLLAEHSDDMVLVLDKVGDCRYVSPSFQRRLAPDGDLTSTLIEVLHAQDRLPVRNLIARCLEDGQRRRLFCRASFIQGETTWLDLLVTPTLDGSSEVNGAVISARNCTEQKIAEQRLLERESTLRVLEENTDELIQISGRDGTLRYKSPSIARKLDLGRDKSTFDALHPDDLRAYEDAVRLASRSGVAQSLRVRLNGLHELLHVDIRIAPLRDTDEGFDGVLVVGRDVTATVLRDETQGIRDEALRLAAKRVYGNFTIWSTSGLSVYDSPDKCKQVSHVLLPGRNIRTNIVSQDRDRVVEAFERLVREGGETMLEFRSTLFHGGVVPMPHRLTALEDKHGVVRFVLARVADAGYEVSP